MRFNDKKKLRNCGVFFYLGTNATRNPQSS